ncbi:DUF5684 domain-containing protein [Chitinolyticbacter albus]|uniref:DUF5684 domain-containing protein n=1 Tax=Chitinolyticbacter albus TaxID=2961951 RepID=UPI00210C42C9|nr:DUF5684 domain-containing protein [Chitinolyticbacter albus]
MAGLLGMLFMLAVVVFIFAAQWKIYTKAGQPGWGSLVPIYNLYLLVKIAKRPDWWIVLVLIPVVNLVALIILTFDIAKHFGRGSGFALGMLFLSFIFYPILAFGDAKYDATPVAA